MQSVTAPIFQKDPNCAYGQWGKNSTGIKEEFRKSAKTIQQFDCYLSKDDVGSIPKRVQQSIFVEFSDDATAKSFAEGESSLYPSLSPDPGGRRRIRSRDRGHAGLPGPAEVGLQLRGDIVIG